MEQLTKAPFWKRDRTLLAIVGLLIAGTAVFAWSDRLHDWRWYQPEFKRRVAEKLGDDKARTVPSGLQQIWVPDLHRADRCTTCHQAVTWKGFETAEEPFRTHPLQILKSHPPEKFGCTACHGGQGYAVDVQDAHAPAEHWEEPLLGKALAESYSIAGDKATLLQMNCNTCHRYDRATPGAEAINRAKQLVNEKGCRACHVINGRGGNIGPDLTYVGDKAPEQYDYTRLLGQKTTYAWHEAHFKDPRALVPETVMPNFHFSTPDVQALSALVLSWRKEGVPPSFLSGAPRTDPQTAEERAAEEKYRTGPGAWFVKTGCFVCHSISVYGVKSPAQIGPTFPLPSRTCRRGSGGPSTTSSPRPPAPCRSCSRGKIVLTPEEKKFAVAQLRAAFAEYQRQKAQGKPPSAAE